MTAPLPDGLLEELAALPVGAHLDTPACASGACGACRANDEATVRKTLELLTAAGWTVLPPAARPDSELPDFDPRTGHRHDCPNQRLIGLPPVGCECAARLYAIADDIERPRPADPADTPEDGHTFRIRASSRGSYAVVGEPHHDAAEFHDVEPFTLEVRAWDLPAALRRAAATPLAAWKMPAIDAGVHAGNVAAIDAELDHLARHGLRPAPTGDDVPTTDEGT